MPNKLPNDIRSAVERWPSAQRHCKAANPANASKQTPKTKNQPPSAPPHTKNKASPKLPADQIRLGAKIPRKIDNSREHCPATGKIPPKSQNKNIKKIYEELLNVMSILQIKTKN